MEPKTSKRRKLNQEGEPQSADATYVDDRNDKVSGGDSSDHLIQLPERNDGDFSPPHTKPPKEGISGKARNSSEQDEDHDHKNATNHSRQARPMGKHGSKQKLEQHEQSITRNNGVNTGTDSCSMYNNSGITNVMLGAAVPYRYGPGQGYGAAVGFGGYTPMFSPEFPSNGNYPTQMPLQMPMHRHYWGGGPAYVGRQFGTTGMHRTGMPQMHPGMRQVPMNMGDIRGGPFGINNGASKAKAYSGSYAGRHGGPSCSSMADYRHRGNNNFHGTANKGNPDDQSNSPNPQNLSPTSQAMQDTNNKATSMGLLTGRSPVILYMSCDDDSLSAFQCLVRKQIEIFEARTEDVDSNAQGRNKPIVLGQVGIRCRHCASVPARNRARASVYYPAKLLGLYQAAQNMATLHLCQYCQQIPANCRSELLALRERKSSAGGGKKYWGDGARVLGVYEANDCLRFEGR